MKRDIPKIKSINISFNLTIVCAFLLLGSCSKNNCNSPIDGPNYSLSETSIDYVSTYDGVTKVFFIDQDGIEQFFNIDSWTDRTSNYSIGLPCEEDPSTMQINEGTSQLIKVQMSSEEYEKSVVITLAETIVIDNKEELTIFYGDPAANNGEEIEGFLGFEISDSNVTSLDSLELNGRIFYDVIEGYNASSNIALKFNKNEGIIYLNKIDEGVVYVYDRVE